MGLFRRKPPEVPSIVLLAMEERDLPARPSHALGPGEDIVGRDESCSIQLLDSRVSRKHLSIDYNAAHGGFVARDLESANGTRLNGETLSTPHVLHEGDVLEVGGSRLLYTSNPAGFLEITSGRRFGERGVRTQADEVE